VLVFRVLGPVEAAVDDTRVDLGGLLPRRLLTALLAAAGQSVSDERLADAVWGAAPPAKASVALQVYVSRLRGAIGREALERDSVGYRLSVGNGSVDTSWFESGVDDGRQLLAAGQAEDASAKLTEALALWRGEPYADLAESDTVDAARSRLVELREIALEELAAARLGSGSAPRAVADLEELVRAAPLRERRWALLILGLYRCGRQGDALAAIRRVRALLADELGVDPGPELQELERRVLAHDPHLELPEGPVVRRPRSAFLGRDAELAALTERLAQRWLVSLIGPAGVGKTRLAVEHAAGVDGAWFARLAEVREPGELPSVVAAAVGLVAVPDDPTAAVIRAIGDRPGLLVLDNCEHIVAAAADLVLALTAGCPRLRILATSREPLGVDGEVTMPVAPLPLAALDGADGAAVALLVDRVQAVRPGWTPSPADLAQVRRICFALDGLPLAIELAAARARVLGLAEIAERLDDRFALLGAVPRGSLAAHATLEAAIGWSVDLLSEVDRALLLRLWPFEGGFTLEAAEAVHGGDALESLSSLVTRSVVVADTTVTPSRYLLLESVRAYCRSLDPTPDVTREAHARWVRTLAAGCPAAIRGKRGGWYLRALGRELPNIRAGLAHDLEQHPELAQRSVGQLVLFFTRGVHHTEALRLVNAAARATPRGKPVDRGRVLIGQIALTYFASRFEETRRLIPLAAEEIFAGFADDEAPTDRCEVLFHLSYAAADLGFAGIALRAAEASIAIGVEHEIHWLVRAARTARDVALVLRAHQAGDEQTMVEAARTAQRHARGWTSAWVNSVLAETLLLHPGPGRAEEALAALRLALESFLQEDDIPYALGALYLGSLALARCGRATDGARLLAAVHRYANRIRVLAPTFFDPETKWVDAAMPVAAEDETLTWSEMVALLAES
jgi:predicted ATPase/DNA-binding SARP family transcriptional activator